LEREGIKKRKKTLNRPLKKGTAASILEEARRKAGVRKKTGKRRALDFEGFANTAFSILQANRRKAGVRKKP
jgi:hypothetical protein